MAEISVHQIPVISTGHLTQEVAERLTANGDKNPWCPCAEWEFGFFLYLDEPEAGLEEPPQCLLDIRDWLKASGFTACWVRLDCDADRVPDLPFYDW